MVEKFENEFAKYCGCEFTIGCGSGTAALWMTLIGLGVKPGDEIITTPSTFIATAEAISFCGATPVFVDVDDTLILYEGVGIHPWGFIYGEPYNTNKKLINQLKAFKGKIVNWSGGGRGYAEQVAKAILPSDLKYFTMSKFAVPPDINPGDIIVDDQLESFLSMKEYGIKVYGPFDDWK